MTPRQKRQREQCLALDVLNVRTTFGQGRTHKEIAAYMGISWQAVRLIEQKALRKLRRPDLQRQLQS